MSGVEIVICDDHEIVRRGLVALLHAEPGFLVVAEAGDGQDALALVEKHHPAVLVTDLVLPGLSGLELARIALQRSPGTQVVLLSMHDDEGYVREALRIGVAGYVLKDSSVRDLVTAVKHAVEGKRFLSTPLAERIVDQYARRATDDPGDIYDSLTQREREILHLAAEGRTAPQIAERLSISPRTVETHRANLMRKLGVSSQSELVRYAIKRGIVRLD